MSIERDVYSYLLSYSEHYTLRKVYNDLAYSSPTMKDAMAIIIMTLFLKTLLILAILIAFKVTLLIMTLIRTY